MERRGGLPLRPGTHVFALVLAVLAARPVLARERPEDSPEVCRLEAAIRTSSDADSVRFLLAQALRNTGTVEGRIRALRVFDEVRSRYHRDPGYHLEIARTYLEGGRVSNARSEFSHAFRLDPRDVGARLACARLLLPSALRYADIDVAEEAIRVLDGALEIAPSDRDGLFLKSLYLCLLRYLDPSNAAARSLAGRVCTEEILARSAHDAEACMLHAVHCLDLGEPRVAARFFRRGLDESGDDVRAAYSDPTFSAPETLLTRLASLPPEERRARALAYWDAVDPTPLTPTNEVLLHYWKRMTLADLFYSDSKTARHGWNTPRGEILVRYGLPKAVAFQHAGFVLGQADMGPDVKLLSKMAKAPGTMTFELQYPTQTWEYVLGGKVLHFTFVDQALQDRFVAASPEIIDRFKALVPSAPMGSLGWNVQRCFASGAGFRGREGWTRQSVTVGVPRWSDDAQWWKGSSTRVRLLRPDGRLLTLADLRIDRSMILSPVEHLEMAVVSGEAQVRPGHYTMEVELTGDAQGSFALPLEVRDFGGDTLLISDLALGVPGPGAAEARPPGSTVPGGLVGPGGRVEVLFELYNLAPDITGRAGYRVRYTVLPRIYALSYAREIESEGRAPDPHLGLGYLGASLGGITLSESNYVDVLFPERTVEVAPRSRGRYSFLLNVAGLDPGEYALVVTVEDCVAGPSVVGLTPFRILSESVARDTLRRE